MHTSSTSRSGSYRGRQYTHGPSRMRRVRWVAAARKMPGTGASPRGVAWCSARWYAEKPAASYRSSRRSRLS